ncbi:MAG: HlyD family secretion protein [Candidatus Omnitrophica bacterium]|nr:HlyD family secretion protein [Candidatus Omnitrophota bacterium]
MIDAKGPKKQKILKIVAGVIIAGLVGIGIYIITNVSHETTDDAYIEGRIHTVASKVSGTVLKVNVEDNQLVRKSELLIEIDPVDYILKVKEAEANLEVRKAALEQSVRDRGRAESLFNGKVIPKEKYEFAFTAYNLAKAQMNAAKQQFNISRQNLRYTKIYSPVDGYVTKKSLEIGNQINLGQPLMAIIGLNDIWLTGNFKETQLKKVKKGQRVSIKVDTYPGKVFTGRVESIMAGTGAAFSLFPPENALGNYVKVVQRVPVKIVFDKNLDQEHVLRIGMSCVPTIITKNE